MVIRSSGSRLGLYTGQQGHVISNMWKDPGSLHFANFRGVPFQYSVFAAVSDHFQEIGPGQIGFLGYQCSKTIVVHISFASQLCQSANFCPGVSLRRDFAAKHPVHV